MFSSNDIANYLLKTLAGLSQEISRLSKECSGFVEQQKRDRDDIEYLKKELSTKLNSSEAVSQQQLSELKAKTAIAVLTLFGGGVAIEVFLRVLGF